MGKKADFVLHTEGKEPPLVTVSHRDEPWRVRIDGKDILILVRCTDVDDGIQIGAENVTEEHG